MLFTIEAPEPDEGLRTKPEPIIFRVRKMKRKTHLMTWRNPCLTATNNVGIVKMTYMAIVAFASKFSEGDVLSAMVLDPIKLWVLECIYR